MAAQGWAIAQEEGACHQQGRHAVLRGHGGGHPLPGLGHPHGPQLQDVHQDQHRLGGSGNQGGRERQRGVRGEGGWSVGWQGPERVEFCWGGIWDMWVCLMDGGEEGRVCDVEVAFGPEGGERGVGALSWLLFLKVLCRRSCRQHVVVVIAAAVVVYTVNVVVDVDDDVAICRC